MGKLIKNLYLFIYFLFKPSYWYLKNSYSEEWDKKLNELMSKHKFVVDGSCIHRLGNARLWTANHPFASFTPHSPARLSVRPSRLTIRKAYKKLVNDMIGDL